MPSCDANLAIWVTPFLFKSLMAGTLYDEARAVLRVTAPWKRPS